MNAKLVVVCCLCMFAAACASAPAAKDDAINSALAAAFVACQVALADPKSEWEPGAKEYCEFIVHPRECKP